MKMRRSRRILPLMVGLTLCLALLAAWSVNSASADTRAWPHLTSLELNGANAVLSKKVGSSTTATVPITAVEFENYDELGDGGTDSMYGDPIYIAGEITLYIEQPLETDATYRLEGDAFIETYAGFTEEFNQSATNIQTNGATEASWYSAVLSAYYADTYDDETEMYPLFSYNIKVVVGSPPSEGPDWPHLTSLERNGANALLAKKVGSSTVSTLPITAVTYENYDELQDGGVDPEWGDQTYIVGGITLYIAQPLETGATYRLEGDVFIETYAGLTGEFEPGATNIQTYGAPEASWYSAVLSAAYAQRWDEGAQIYTYYCYNIKVVAGPPPSDADPPFLTAGQVTRSSDTAATVKFTSDEAGAYYYAVADDGAAAPTVETGGEGTAMVAGENTITLFDLTSDGAKKIYIMAQDDETTPNVTASALVIDIPAYSPSTGNPEFVVKSLGAAFEVLWIMADGEDVSFTKERDMESIEVAYNYSALIEPGASVTCKVMPAVGISHVKDLQYVAYKLGDGTASNWIPADGGSVDKLTFSFTMPEQRMTVTQLYWNTTAPAIPRYGITASASDYKEGVTSPMGTVFIASADGFRTTQAEAGETITVSTEPAIVDGYDFSFDHWEATGLTIAEPTANPLSFTMPENAVNIKAVYRKQGVSITYGLNRSDTSNVALEPRFGTTKGLDAAGTAVTDTIKTGTVCTFTLLNNNAAYKFNGWTVLESGQDITDTGKVTISTGDFPSVSFTTVADKTYTVTANIADKAFAKVTAAVNDSAMGAATASAGGSDQTVINGALEGQTITVKANPETGYLFKQWSAAYDDESDIGTDVSFADDSAATTTFVMPATSRDITVTAAFERDPAYASSECEITDVALYAASSATEPLGTVDQAGNAFTITLPYSTDTSNLSQMILRIDHSAGATVTKSGDGEAKEWATGQACGMTLDTPATFTVLAEDGQHSAIYSVIITKAARSDKDITAVRLCESDGTIIASGVVSGTAVTITLPENTSQSVLNNIGMKYLKITHSTGSSVAQSGGYDDTAGSFKWANGDVMCNMSLNTAFTFTVTAEDGSTKDYTVTIVYTAPDAPTLSNGSAERTSDTAATVTFTSSEAGYYYYAVVAGGATAPTVSTSGSGTTASAGSNTINLTNLTAGARDIYIVVKNQAGSATSAALRVAIPAFAGGGGYTVSTSYNSAYGGITVSPSAADAGDTVTVTVTPQSGYQMTAGSLKYTPNEAGAAGTAISGNSFIMPAYDVTVSCEFEVSTGGVTPATDGITAFSINGVAGVVNQSTLTISILMPYGTDVASLTPSIATHNVTSLSPASGKARNFRRPVTYEATLADGSIKSYVVTVYVQDPSPAQQMWEDLTDFYDQVPWWEHAEDQVSEDRYPSYWH